MSSLFISPDLFSSKSSALSPIVKTGSEVSFGSGPHQSSVYCPNLRELARQTKSRASGAVKGYAAERGSKTGPGWLVYLVSNGRERTREVSRGLFRITGSGLIGTERQTFLQLNNLST